MPGEVKVCIERQALNVLLAEVGTKDESTETGLDLTGARSGWNGLTIRQGRQTEQAGETADEMVPLQQGASLRKRNMRRFLMVRQSGLRQYKSVVSRFL